MVLSRLPSEAMSTNNIPCGSVGQRIECNGYYGTVMYIGEVPPTDGPWLGIDWDDPSRGKHDGSHNGVSYFKARYPTSGSFVRVGKVNFGEDCITALYNRYGEVKDDETAGVDKIAMASIKREMKASLFEVVGFSKVNKKQSEFENLLVVYLRGYNVNGAGTLGELRKLCPRVQELDLSRNLFNSWESISNITQQLPELVLLNVSENQLGVPSDPSALKDLFVGINHMVVGRMGYTWTDILECSKMWPDVQTLQVPFNAITHLHVPSSNTLQNIKVLDMEGNSVGDWNEIMKLGTLRSLESLNIANNGVTVVRFPTDRRQKTDLFPNLKLLVLSENEINEWESVCELDKLRNLEDLRLLNNPLLQQEAQQESQQEVLECREFVIARVAALKKLNGAFVTTVERKNAEYDYLKRHGQHWLEIHGKEDEERLKEQFISVHPRYPSLVQKYGALEEGEMKSHSNALKTKLINVEIFSPKISGKVFRKKLPLNMSVQKLLGMVQKLFNTSGEVPTLVYRSSKNPTIEVSLENEMKEIGFYAMEDGDRISVNWS